MKGLLIGLSSAIRGLFQLLAVCTVLILMYTRQFYCNSCEIDYNLLNMILCIIGLVVYIYVAKRYELRERDEP